MTDTGISIKITYLQEQQNKTSIFEFEGLKLFKKELSENYISVIHGRPGDLGGGIGEFVIDLISNITLKDLVNFLLEGIAYDLISSKTKKFVIRPLFEAYKKLKGESKNSLLDLAELNISFQDSIVRIYKVSDNSIINQLENILLALAKNYDHLILDSGEAPYQIYIPVLEDKVKTKNRIFRVPLGEEETIEKISEEDYFKYWGLIYDYERCDKIYNVEKQLLIAEGFYSEDQYWKKWHDFN